MLLQETIYFNVVNEDRRIHIYLPDDYYETNEAFPVMYFFDGQNLFLDEHATYGTSWGLNDFMQSWDKPMIIVGLECSHTGDNRLSEYSPYRLHMFGKTIEPFGEETYQWLINTVKPHIDATYRTYSHREATGIAGSSMGGLMSAYGIIKHNDVFSKAVVLSTGGMALDNLLKDLSSATINPDSRVYISWGEREAGDAFGSNPAFDTPAAQRLRTLESAYQDKNMSTYLYFQKDGEHNEASWCAQNDIYMNFLWK